MKMKMIDIPNIKKGVRQLFLDDQMIAQTQGMKQVLNQPTRYPENPVIRGEYPGEKASTSVYGTAIYDEEMGRFRLWYLCTPGPQSAERKWVEVKGDRRVTNCTLVACVFSQTTLGKNGSPKANSHHRMEIAVLVAAPMREAL